MPVLERTKPAALVVSTGAEACTILQADIRATAIVDWHGRGDCDVCDRAVLLEQVERTTV